MLNEIVSIIRSYTDNKKEFTKYDIYNQYKLRHKSAKSYNYYKKLITLIINELLLEYDYKKSYIRNNKNISTVYKCNKSKIKSIELNIDSYGRIYLNKNLMKYLNVIHGELVQKTKTHNSIIISSKFNESDLDNVNCNYLYVGKYNSLCVYIGKRYSTLNNVNINIYNNKLEIILI